MKRILLPVLMVFIAIIIGCGGGGGGAPSAPTGVTVVSNPSPKHGYYTIGSLLAAGPSGVPITIYGNDEYTVSVGTATLVASGRPDNAVIRVMTTAGRNSSDCLIFSDGGNVSFETFDSYESPSSDLVMKSTGGSGTGSDKTADLEKIDKTVFSRSLIAGVTYQPGNRLKLSVWNIVGGNADTKLVPLISSYQG